MKIKVTYIGILNGVAGLWCGFKPEGAKIKDRKYVLYPDEGYKLQDKEGKLYDSVVLEGDDSEENYVEVKDSNKALNVD